MFLKRKKDILSKQDKSSKGFWDKHIESLCEKINVSDDCYTTSSCSGRVVLMIDQDKKEGGLLLNVSHELISFEWLKKALDKILKESDRQIKFKMESCALHVACKTLEKAQELYDKAKLAGWKKSGIIASSGSRIMIEMSSTEKLEFPIINDGKVLVDDEFLKLIVEEANKKLKRGWSRIEGFEKEI